MTRSSQRGSVSRRCGNPFPTLFSYRRIGSGTPPAIAPPSPPGADLKVGTESRRHEEVFKGRWCHELHRYSHQLTPRFTPPIQRLHRSLGMASLATGVDVRVLPRLLETKAKITKALFWVGIIGIAALIETRVSTVFLTIPQKTNESLSRALTDERTSLGGEGTVCITLCKNVTRRSGSRIARGRGARGPWTDK